MIRRITALCSLAVLTAALMAVVAAPVGAQEEEPLDTDLEFGCLLLGDEALFLIGFTPSVDIDSIDAATITSEAGPFESLVFVDPVTDEIVTDPEAGQVVVALVGDEVAEAGPAWLVEVEVTWDEGEEEATLLMEVLMDPCTFDVDIEGACTADGITAVIEITFDNDFLVTVEIVDGFAVLPNGEIVELEFDPSVIPDGESAVSEPFEITGELQGPMDVVLEAVFEDAVVYGDGDPENLEAPITAFFVIEGCEIVPVELEPEPEPAEPVAAEPTLTG